MRLKKPHYAWTVCIGCALLLFCTSGLAVNAFTIYQPFIMEQNGFSNTQTSSIVSFRTFAGLVGMLLSGVFYKKVSLRNGMGLAGIASAAGFALFGLAKTYPVYCLAAAVTGIGYGLGAMIPIAIVIRSWFYESRNLAIGICSAATGLSTVADNKTDKPHRTRQDLSRRGCGHDSGCRRILSHDKKLAGG